MAATVISVSNAIQLTAAIRAVKGGETIKLAPGDYGSVTINGRNLKSNVTITSADPSNDASFSSLRVATSSNWTFDDIDLHKVLAKGQGDWTQTAYISGSQNITMRGLDVTGSMDKNSWNDGWGIRVSYSKDVQILDSTFEQLKIAAIFDHSTDLVLAGNTVTDVREGFDFAAVHRLTVAQNHFSNFTPNYKAGDHSDAIQVWTMGVNEGSSQIMVRDNVMLMGASGGVQGIHISTEVPAYRFTDVTVQNNLYYGDAQVAIHLNGVDGGVVRSNTLVTAVGGVLEAGIMIRNDTNIEVDHNISPLTLVFGGSKNINVHDNIDLWDRYYNKTGSSVDSIFGSAPTPGAPVDMSAFVVKAGSLAAAAQAGFSAIAGIGAASFDLANPATYHNLANSHLHIA